MNKNYPLLTIGLVAVRGDCWFRCRTQGFHPETVVQRQTVPAGEHTVELSLTKLVPGSYHYTLEVAGRPVAHHNLMVQ